MAQGSGRQRSTCKGIPRPTVVSLAVVPVEWGMVLDCSGHRAIWGQVVADAVGDDVVLEVADVLPGEGGVAAGSVRRAEALGRIALPGLLGKAHDQQALRDGEDAAAVGVVPPVSAM